MPNPNLNKAGAVAAFVGAACLFTGTFLHPSSANPNDPLAAFTEYTADKNWVKST